MEASEAPTMNLAATLGTGLRTARELKNLSLREVEAATGISNAYLSQLENGKVRKPSPHFLHKLATLYGVGYEMFLEAAGYLTRTAASAEGPKTLAGAALWSRESLTAEEEQELAKYLAYLRSKKQ
jgi:transcriptional regulator with XRE-family HTH domain